jgi:site-specific recombinase XerD
MPSVKFYLESKVKGENKKLLPIFLYVRAKGKTLKVYTERKCTRHAWDVDRNRASPRKFNNATELNGFLSELEEETYNTFNYNARNGLLTTKDDLLRLIQKLGGNAMNDQSLIRFATEFLSKTKLSEATLKAYRTTINTLNEYKLAKRKSALDFNDIDLNFYDDFTSWLWKEKHLNDNSVGKHIKIIKALMSQAFERDLHSNLHFKKKKFHAIKNETDSVYLTHDELLKLLKQSFKDNEKLKKVRDVFLVACWTGLRFSDLSRVTKDKFIVEDKIEMLKIESQKTGEIVKIPISPLAKPILERYNFHLPILSNQKMNEYLKQIAEEAAIDQEVELTDLKGGKKVRKTFKKHELITTHTARRSFASNLYLQGVSSKSIMAVTGHRTEKAFLAYIKLSQMERIRDISTHFKKAHRNLKIS